MRELKILQNYTVRTQSLDLYLKSISHEPLIGVEEEVALAERIHKGDEKALDRLVRANLRFVVSIAKQYNNTGMELMDLINEGNMGLIEAARRFDETRGFKFISYAVWWIRQQILLAISEQGNIIRKPLNHATNLSRINRINAKFEQENGRRASTSELADMLNIGEDKITSALVGSGRTMSMDAPFNDDEDNTLLDVISEDDDVSVEKNLMSESLSTDLNNVLGSLSTRDKSVICMFYGIGERQYTLDEIGDHLNLSRERVRQIKDRSIRSLRSNPRSRVLRNYL